MKTLELLDYNKVLQDFVYKPNWSYAAYEREGEWWIRIVMLVENSRAPWRRWELKPAADEEVWFGRDWRDFRPATFTGYSPSREVIEVMGNFPIPHVFGPEHDKEFISWMVYTIKSMEEHESDEWIRYKGELLNDPHKEITP